MKKYFLLLLLLIPFLAGCQNNNNPSGSGSGVSYDTTISFYIDFSATDPLCQIKANFGQTFSLPQEAELDNSKAPDPAFPIFLGYSSHAVINSTEDLWKFNEDKVPDGETNLKLYGIWVEE